MTTKPPYIKHWREVIASDDSTYPGSEEKFSIGAPLGRMTGLLRLGVHFERLMPGRRTSWPHAERDEEEFVYVLEGTPDVWIDGHLHRLEPGDCVGFPSATGIAHTFINDTEREVRLLVVGERSKPNHGVFYPLHPDHQAILGERDWTDAPKRPLGPHDGKPTHAGGPAHPVLDTLRLRLRPVRPSDAQAYLEMRRDPDVGRYLMRAPPESIADAEREISRILSQHTVFGWALVRRDEDKLLGVIGLPRFDRYQKSTSIAFELRRDEWGKGLMGEAANKVIAYAFDKLGVHRIQAEIDPKNSASIHLCETLGFVREGILRDSVYVNGAFADTAIYALFKSR